MLVLLVEEVLCDMVIVLVFVMCLFDGLWSDSKVVLLVMMGFWGWIVCWGGVRLRGVKGFCDL